MDRQIASQVRAPWPGRSLAWLNGRMTACARGVMLGALVVGTTNLRNVYESSAAVEHSYSVRAGLRQLLATLADAEKAGAVTLNIGMFMETVLQFLIVSFAMFWLVKGMAYLYRRPAAAPQQSPPRSEVLLEEIRDILAEKRA